MTATDLDAYGRMKPAPRLITHDDGARSFAVIPAAGASVRMGRPKLLLPWGNSTVIDAVLTAWLAGGVDQVVVVVRADDRQLAAAVRRPKVRVVLADPAPVDMRASLLVGIDTIATEESPTMADVVFAAPADLPGFSSQVVARLLAAWRGDPLSNRAGWIATISGRTTHPVALRWPAAAAWRSAAIETTLKALVASGDFAPVACDDLIAPELRGDLDDPTDYARLLRACGTDVQS